MKTSLTNHIVIVNLSRGFQGFRSLKVQKRISLYIKLYRRLFIIDLTNYSDRYEIENICRRKHYLRIR